MNYSGETSESHPDKQPVKVSAAQWMRDEKRFQGAVEGTALGTNVTVLFYETDRIGEGPKWHVHTYDEVFIVRNGNALFTIGDQKIEASKGDVLMGPANVPHKYHNVGPGTLQTTDIHLADQWEQEDLIDPELSSE